MQHKYTVRQVIVRQSFPTIELQRTLSGSVFTALPCICCVSMVDVTTRKHQPTYTRSMMNACTKSTSISLCACARGIWYIIRYIYIYIPNYIYILHIYTYIYICSIVVGIYVHILHIYYIRYIVYFDGILVIVRHFVVMHMRITLYSSKRMLTVQYS